MMTHAKRNFALLLATTLAALTSSARAGTLIDVVSTYPDGYHGGIEAVEAADTGDIQNFVYKDSRGTELTYTVEQIREGVVILRALGKDIIRLRAPGFNAQSGGPFKVQFLRRFLGSDVREVELELFRASAGAPWDVRTNDKQGRDLIDHLQAVVGMTAGIPGGVDRIKLLRGKALVRDYDPNDLPKVRQGRRATKRRP